MTHHGTYDGIFDPASIVIDFTGTYTMSQVHIPMGVIDYVWNVDPAPIAKPPILGQIWPRGMVGPYYGPTYIPGTAVIFELSQAVEGKLYTVGQLWPRGDYIPSKPSI